MSITFTLRRVPNLIRPGSPVFFVGEAPGEKEADTGQPFVGPSGALLRKLLSYTDLDLDQCSLGNVFQTRPPGNELKFLTSATPMTPSSPMLDRGMYIKPEYSHEPSDLLSDIAAARPNLIVPLGSTACWALLGQAAIKKFRGFVYDTPHGKVLPTYHPAAALRDWRLQTTIAFDLIKAATEARSPKISSPPRHVYLAEHPHDLPEFWSRHGSPIFSCDIETKRGQITTVGLASTTDHALIVPFSDQHGGSYWNDPADELACWNWLDDLLSNPKHTVVFHNGAYDLQYLYRTIGIRPRAKFADTMLLHHAYMPEAERSLNYLGSIYTNVQAWKQYRRVRAADKSLKKDD